MTNFERAMENLSHAVSTTNKLDAWKRGEPEPYLLHAAKELLAMFGRTPEETAPKSAQIHCAECQGRCKHIASKPAETAPKCHLGAKCFKLLPDAEECTCGFKGPAYRGPVKTTSKESK